MGGNRVRFLEGAVIRVAGAICLIGVKVLLLTEGRAGSIESNSPEVIPPFRWPLQTDPGLSASFCEFRPGHFHAGIDIKTWGARSVPCVAIADGRISRVKVQSTGYGKALYLALPDGRIAAYAHLDRFAAGIDARVREVQERTGEFEVDLFWEGDSGYPVRAGEVIAHSGVSGTTHPHLHFEMRKGYSITRNPLLSGFAIADQRPPVPVALALTPLDAESSVEGDYQPRLYSRLLRRPDGIYEPGDPIGATGRIGISVDAYDQTDNATNELAVHRIELYVGGEVYWTTSFDWFDYADSRQIELERDYRLQRRGKGSYHRLYRAEGNRLPLGQGVGIIDAGFGDAFPIDVEIVFSDVNRNRSSLKMRLVSDQVEDTSRSVGGKSLVTLNGNGQGARERIGIEVFDGFIRLAAPPGVAHFKIRNLDLQIPAISIGGGVAAAWKPFDGMDGVATIEAVDHKGVAIGKRDFEVRWATPETSLRLLSDDSLAVAEFLPGTVHDGTLVRLEREQLFEDPGFVETVVRLEPRDQALAGRLAVKLRRSENGTTELGWGVYYFRDGRGWVFLGAETEGGFLTAPATSLERFALVRDTTAPTIAISSPSHEKGIGPQPQLSAMVKDELSGIAYRGIEVYLDGRKVPAEYDQPRARISYRPPKALGAGKHELVIAVSDRSGNRTRRSIVWQIP
ncbi:MAG: M23 family metallopeptidase [Calditrichaeota bacterium]|nr:M23 family metallopeptidase [Calditrichota bacterium]